MRSNGTLFWQLELRHHHAMTILSVTGPAHDDQLRVRSRAEPSIASETMPMGSVFQKSFRDFLSLLRAAVQDLNGYRLTA